MVKRFKYKFVLFFVLFLCIKGFATHIVGGEMFYDYLGGNTYKVTLKMYRDCLNGQAPFDGLGGGPTAYLHIFDSAGNLIQQIDIGQPVVTPIPPTINNPCIQTPSGICVEEGKYEATITLLPKTGGYYLVYQRCCRNNTILNLTGPGGQGATYQAFIPGPDVVASNSSPRYTNFPQIFICNGLNLNFDHSATDPDGDVLVYSLCSPYNGLDGCCPSIGYPPSGAGPYCPTPPPSCPTVAAAPPYPLVNFLAPYNGSYPVSSNPSLSINSSTGLLTGVPNLNGQWVVGVCVEEYRNGNLISKHYRDFQFNVMPCVYTALAAIADQPSKCQGDTINFINQSVGATNYLWNFGVNEIFSDTSIVKNPSYVYPDTGVYNVSLIINKGKPCVDSVRKKFYIYPRLKIDFLPQNVQCLKSNNFNFNVRGSYINSATFNWNFSAAATPSTSTMLNPGNITFNQAGKFFVKVVGKQYTCVDSFIDSVRILNRPVAKINNFPTSMCDPGKVAFSNGSSSEYPPGYLWQTSDGSIYSSYEPTHTFSPPGVYSLTLTLIRGGVCPDTSQTSINTFTVNPSPKANFIFTPSITSIFDPEILFIDSSFSDIVTWRYDFGDYGFSTFMNEKHTYLAPGTYGVNETVTNKYNCVNRVTKEVTILPEFRFWIPNAFTPDNNGLNDVFRPVTIGVSDYKFDIFDRWGQRVFTTTDIGKGWDGNFKGKPCKEDIYVWLISYKNGVTEKFETKTGHVVLLGSQNGSY